MIVSTLLSSTEKTGVELSLGKRRTIESKYEARQSPFRSMKLSLSAISTEITAKETSVFQIRVNSTLSIVTKPEARIMAPSSVSRGVSDATASSIGGVYVGNRSTLAV